MMHGKGTISFLLTEKLGQSPPARGTPTARPFWMSYVSNMLVMVGIALLFPFRRLRYRGWAAASMTWAGSWASE